MADAYWGYGNARYQAPASAPVKRPRTDYGEVPVGQERIGYYPRNEERVGYPAMREPENLAAQYDPYLRNGPVSSFVPGETARPGLVEMPRRPVDDMRIPRTGPTDGQTVGYGGGRLEKPLPPDASNTLFVEGLPADCTRREVSHIFRPFPGFREVRLVSKESKRPGGDPWVLCFVDFSTASQAAVALDCLEGYKFDEHDRESSSLRMQFSRFPGPRSGGGPGPRSGGGPGPRSGGGPRPRSGGGHRGRR